MKSRNILLEHYNLDFVMILNVKMTARIRTFQILRLILKKIEIL